MQLGIHSHELRKLSAPFRAWAVLLSGNSRQGPLARDANAANFETCTRVVRWWQLVKANHKTIDQVYTHKLRDLVHLYWTLREDRTSATLARHFLQH